MKWEKKGLIYGVKNLDWWRDNSALQPTPILLGDKIRVFVGFRDKNGVGRVGYVDVDAADPSKVLKVSEKPCLDVGEPGCFDDNGIVPCAVIQEGEKLYLYYAGYNIGYHVRMTIFSGLAVSTDGGETFTRCSRVPVMERTDKESLFRVVHTALKDDDGYKIYYGAGDHFIQGKKKTLPVYDVKLLMTDQFDALQKEGASIVTTQGDEYRVGRPYVVKENGLYRMFTGAGTERITYYLIYAESQDGIHWTRKDDELNLSIDGTGFDSEMMAYPAFIRYKEKAYLFYNGNNYGYEGFGYAELISE